MKGKNAMANISPDNSHRIPVIEPLLLILKSRKGIAFIASIIALTMPLWTGIGSEMAFELAVASWVYIGGQSFVDGRQAASKTQEEVKKMIETAVKEKL